MAFRKHKAAPILAVLLVLSLAPGVAAVTVTRLDENFVSTDARWAWMSGSTGSGATRISGSDASLLIESGVQSGTVTWAETVQSFDTSSGYEQIVNIRCAPSSTPSGPGDMSFWGLRHEASGHAFAIGYWVKWGPTGPMLEARVRNATLTRAQLLPGIDVMAVNDYRLEVLEDRARFLVNDHEVWEFTGYEVPQGLLRVRLEKTSPGRNKVLAVQSVRVEEDLTAQAARLETERDDRGGAAAPAAPVGGTLGDEPAGAAAAIEPSSWADIKAAYR